MVHTAAVPTGWSTAGSQTLGLVPLDDGQQGELVPRP